jgi:tetratricopeptide (TPR) repeat protein
VSFAGVVAGSISIGSVTSHQHFHGEGHARSRYRAEIEELLRRHDEAFVGRSHELARLVAFITSRAPGYLLVEAAGGQGKSALMAQLLLRTERGEMPGSQPNVVAFFVRDPGGQRPDDFLSAINGQLLSLLGRSGGTHYDVRALRNQFSELWDDARTRATAERPLLLLVDALDEQAGGELTIASLLPESLADNVHVIVSSRPRPDARERVGTGHPLRDAQVLTLAGLDSLDVRTLLLRGLGSRLAEGDADRLAARIHTLSRGEALLARHICEDVIARGEAVLNDIERSPPRGIHDYFLRQVREIDEAADADATWDACALLAVALGPMSLDEIADVLDVGRRQARRALEPVDRYLLGRDRLQFFHRNLYTTILEEIGEKDAAAWRGRLADWCAARAHAPAQPVPRYALEHYGEHLVAENRIAELIALPGEPWLREHRREFHALTAFARDVDLAYRACVPTPSAPTHPLDGLRMSVLLGSIGSTAQNVPPDAIWVLARTGRLEEAEGYVHLSADPVARVRALAALARALTGGAEQARGRAALDEALPLVLDAERPASSAVGDVVQAALEFADAQVWLDILSRLMSLNPAFSSDVAEVASIGVHAHREGRTDIVAGVRQYLADLVTWLRSELARYLATRAKLHGGAAPPDAQPFDVDEEGFEDIEDRFYEDLLTIADAALRFEDATGDAALTNAVEALVTTIPDDFLRAPTLARFAQAQAARGQTVRALELARRAAAHSDASAANAVSPEVFVISQMAECVPVMIHGDLASIRNELVSKVAERCRALPAGNWTSGYERLVQAWAAVGRADDLESLLASTAPAGGEYADYGLRSLHAAIARGLLTCGRLEAAATAMERLPGDVSRDHDRLDLIGRFLDAGRADLAQRTMSRIDYRPNRVAGLALMAARVERHGDRDGALTWLERAIAAATVFGDESARVSLLAEAGRALASLGRRDEATRLAAQAAALNAPLPAGLKLAGSEVALALLHVEVGDTDGFLRVAPRRGDNWGMRYLSRYADALMARDGFHALSTFTFETMAEEPQYLWPGDRVEHLAIRARVLRMLGYTTKATECIQAALAGLAGDGTADGKPDGAGFAEVARYLSESGEADRAAEILEQGVTEGVHRFPEASLARLARGFAACGRQDRATAVATDALAAIDFTAVYASTDGVHDALMAHAPAEVPGVVDAFLARARRDGRTDDIRGVSVDAARALQDLRQDRLALSLLFETLPLFRGEARSSLLWALSQWAPLLSRLDPSGLLRLCEWTEEVTGWWERA